MAKKPTAKPDVEDVDTQVEEILDECEIKVNEGLRKEGADKVLSTPARKALREMFGESIRRNLDRGGEWKHPDKQAPLAVAHHLGQIAAILSIGNLVGKAVALAAAAAARNDEHCRPGGGGGDWCN